MKNRASVFLKQTLSVITSLVKSKTMAIKNKTSAMKTRIIIYSLLNNKKVLMSSISHKFNSLLRGQLLLDKKQRQQQGGAGEPNHDDDDNHDYRSINKAIVLYRAMANQSSNPTLYEELAEEEEEESHDHKYPDLTHTLFESDNGEEELDEDDNDGGNQTMSVIDLVRNSKEEVGENFRLEDEIDQVADLFIRRFHQQMRMQKQESFKRYQEMLQRSV